MQTERIRVSAGRGYDILLGCGALGGAGELIASIARGRKAAVVTDTTVGPLYGETVAQSLRNAGFEAPVFAFEAGELSKKHTALLDIYAFLAREEVTRSDLIIALGGGVVGDMAGFAAATWQRGVDFVQIPTTLLAQVDSSIGGKTGLDLPQGKNLVGAFWQPSLVVCDPLALHTLDDRNYACGMAEVIKHACIKTRALFDALPARGCAEKELTHMIRENLMIKRGVVERDEKEQGERMQLNFGHTPGHAIEKLSAFTGFTHGEAVAMGMVLMAEAGERHGLTEPGTAQAIREMLKRHGLPAESPYPTEALTRAMLSDKKRSGGELRLVLLRRIGEAFVYPLPVDELAAFFAPQAV